jgi:hypothetical protein
MYRLPDITSKSWLAIDRRIMDEAPRRELIQFPAQAMSGPLGVVNGGQCEVRESLGFATTPAYGIEHETRRKTNEGHYLDGGREDGRGESRDKARLEKLADHPNSEGNGHGCKHGGDQ